MARWLAGEFELVVSGLLLSELERTLAYPKLRARLTSADAAAFVTLLRHAAVIPPGPSAPARRSPDPGDDYLLALAEDQGALLVSGGQHLLGLAERFPIRTSRAFLEALERGISE